MVPQLSSVWQHNYSTKTRQPVRANEQSMYSLMSMSRSIINATQATRNNIKTSLSASTRIIMTLIIITFSITTLSIMTFSINNV